MNKKISLIALALASTYSFAGVMGELSPNKFFLLEGGLAYDFTPYKGNSNFAESYTPIIPNSVARRPKNFYPNNFFGGYAGMSFYFPSWLINARYNLYGSKSKVNLKSGTSIKVKPSNLSFTADRVFGNFNAFSYGVGGGVVVKSVNAGRIRVNPRPNWPPSTSLQGRSFVDPLVEAFLMYRCNNNWGVKFNTEYQLSTNETIGFGYLNFNLGINYAFPI